MNVEGYVLEIIKTIEEKGYEAYIAGTAVLLHCLEKSIEEYDIITSAPLFFLHAGKVNKNRLEIHSFSKRIKIYFETSQKEYKNYCCFQAELIFYHPKHGISGEVYAFQDIEAHRLNAVRMLATEELMRALCYKYGLDFEFSKELDEAFLVDHNKQLSIKSFFPYLRFFLMLDTPSIVFKSYYIFLKPYLSMDIWLAAIDFLKPDFNLRFAFFLLGQLNSEQWLMESLLNLEDKQMISSYLFSSNLSENRLFPFLYEKNISHFWFPIERAKALAKKDLIRFMEVENLYTEYLNYIKETLHLKISRKKLLEIGFTEEECEKVILFLRKEIRLQNIKNCKEELTTKANRIFQEKIDLDIIY